MCVCMYIDTIFYKYIYGYKTLKKFIACRI